MTRRWDGPWTTGGPWAFLDHRARVVYKDRNGEVVYKDYWTREAGHPAVQAGLSRCRLGMVYRLQLSMADSALPIMVRRADIIHDEEPVGLYQVLDRPQKLCSRVDCLGAARAQAWWVDGFESGRLTWWHGEQV